MEMKQFFFLLEKKKKNGRFSKWPFFKITNSQNLFLISSWIGPWVSRMD
jgi:hypothetical protein